MNRTKTRRRALVLALAISAVLPIVGAAAPAQAVAVNTLYTLTTPATWVDGQGRQYQVVSTTGGTLNVARDTATGVPDTTWGANGVRGLALTPPASGATLPNKVAVTDGGLLTVPYTEPGCSDSGICDRLFARFDGVTGEPVGSPTTVPDERNVFRALDDGSVLLGTEATALRWYGPDGTLRATPGLTGDQLDGADVDAAGRLLVLATSGTLTRWPATVPATPDLTVTTVCGAEMPGGAVGAAPEGGFAVVCAESGAGFPTTTRYDGSGEVSWTVPNTALNLEAIPVQRVTVDAAGKVWYGGYAPGTVWLFIVPGRVAVASVTAGGAQPAAYSRSTTSAGSLPSTDLAGGGITDLRTAPDGSHVALADLKVCCRYPSNQSASMWAYGKVLPMRPGPPRCRAYLPSIFDAESDGLTVRFGGCYTNEANADPTHFRVDATGPSGNATATTPNSGPASSMQVPLTGLAPGERIAVTVTPVNSYGDSTLAPVPLTTVLPFISSGYFVERQIADLGRKSLWPADRTAAIDAITSGTRTPAELMEELVTEGPGRTWVEPPARLYRAAFLRDADIGGLRYWFRERRHGVRVVTIAEHFARSSEFQRRYGTLTNRQFVERIYQNVLGRPGDQAGIAYWTRRLDTRAATRGAVLAGFSESSEFIRKTSSSIQTLTITFLMLDRRPTTAERATWATSDAVYAEMPLAVLKTPEYAARVEGYR